MTPLPPLTLLEGKMSVPPVRAEPLHAQLRRTLRSVIDEHFSDGQRFWPESMLIEQLGVSQITIRRALLDLAQEGVLERRPPKGSFVRKAPEVNTLEIGCLVPQYDSEFWNEMIENLTVVCREHGYQFRLHHTHRGENLSDIRRHLDNTPRNERFVLLGAIPQDVNQMWDALDDKGYHSICIDTPTENRPSNFVGADSAKGIQIGLEHLRELGHERILFLGNEPNQHPTVIAQERAFLESKALLGLEKATLISCDTQSWENSYEAAWRVMPQVWENRPTAIMTSSDYGAFAALGWLQEQGIRVPAEVSVLGFGNVRQCQFCYPQLTSIAQPIASIAKWAIELLTTKPDQPQKLLLEPKLVVRRSTGPSVG